MLEYYEQTALDELYAAARDALGPTGPYAMSTHLKTDLDAGFMRQWYERIRVDPNADQYDLRDFYLAVRTVTIDGASPQSWDSQVSGEDLAAASIPYGPKEATLTAVLVRTGTTVAGAAVKAAKAVAAIPSKGFAGFTSGMSSLGDYLATAMRWGKWLFYGVIVLAVAFVAYRFARLFR